MEKLFYLNKNIKFNSTSNELHFPSEELLENDRAVRLEKRLSLVLLLLLKNPNKVIDRTNFVEKIWEGNSNVGNLALTKAISSLRNILKKNQPGSERLIETIPKVGYRLKMEIHEPAPSLKRQRYWPMVPVTINIKGAHLAILLVFLFFIIKWSTRGLSHAAGHQLWH